MEIEETRCSSPAGRSCDCNWSSAASSFHLWSLYRRRTRDRTRPIPEIGKTTTNKAINEIIIYYIYPLSWKVLQDFLTESGEDLDFIFTGTFADDKIHTDCKWGWESNPGHYDVPSPSRTFSLNISSHVLHHSSWWFLLITVSFRSGLHAGMTDVITLSHVCRSNCQFSPVIKGVRILLIHSLCCLVSQRDWASNGAAFVLYMY